MADAECKPTTTTIASLFVFDGYVQNVTCNGIDKTTPQWENVMGEYIEEIQGVAYQMDSTENCLPSVNDCNKAAAMLRDYAALLERQASVVPVCWSLRHEDGTGALFADCIYENEDDAYNDALELNGEHGKLVTVPLFAHPPAQASALTDWRETVGACHIEGPKSDVEHLVKIIRSGQASAVPDVREMVNRFLGWTLPKDFCPDAGISYNPAVNINHTTGEPYPNTPSGTNLFTAEQAEQMIRHMLATPQLAQVHP